MNPQENAPVTPSEAAPAPAPIAPITQKIAGPGELLSHGWKVLKDHWKVLAPIFLLPTVVTDIGILIMYAENPITYIIGVIIILGSLILYVASMPALIQAVHKLATGTQVITLKEQYKYGFSVFWSYVLIAIIVLFISMGSLMLLIIPGIIVGVYTSLYAYTFVIDGKKGFSALTESYRLIRGRWWGVFGRFIVLGLIMMVVSLIVAGLTFLVNLAFPAGAVDSALESFGSTGSFIGTFIGMIISLIGNAVIGLIGAGYIYRMYVSLKATQQQDVATKTFKNWLIAFIVIGIIGIPLMIMVAVSLASLNSARMNSLDAQSYTQERMAEIQAEIERQIQMEGTSVPAQ